MIFRWIRSGKEFRRNVKSSRIIIVNSSICCTRIARFRRHFKVKPRVIVLLYSSLMVTMQYFSILCSLQSDLSPEAVLDGWAGDIPIQDSPRPTENDSFLLSCFAFRNLICARIITKTYNIPAFSPHIAPSQNTPRISMRATVDCHHWVIWRSVGRSFGKPCRRAFDLLCSCRFMVAVIFCQ